MRLPAGWVEAEPAKTDLAAAFGFQDAFLLALHPPTEYVYVRELVIHEQVLVPFNAFQKVGPQKGPNLFTGDLQGGKYEGNRQLKRRIHHGEVYVGNVLSEPVQIGEVSCYGFREDL